MRVLILSCGTGGGHNAAASAMKEALEARGHSADVLNPYTLKTNKLAKIIDVVYVRLVQISPTLFGCDFIKLVMPTADCHGVHSLFCKCTDGSCYG